MYYALCNGEELPACESCKRFVDNNPEAAKDSYQTWQKPMIVEHDCADWQPRVLAPRFP